MPEPDVEAIMALIARLGAAIEIHDWPEAWLCWCRLTTLYPRVNEHQPCIGAALSNVAKTCYYRSGSVH